LCSVQNGDGERIFCCPLHCHETVIVDNIMFHIKDSIEKRVFLLVQKKRKEKKRSNPFGNGSVGFTEFSPRFDPARSGSTQTHTLGDGWRRRDGIAAVDWPRNPTNHEPVNNVIDRGNGRRPVVAIGSSSIMRRRRFDQQFNYRQFFSFVARPADPPRGSEGVRRRCHRSAPSSSRNGRRNKTRKRKRSVQREREREIFCCWLFFSFSLRKVKKKKKKKRPLSAFHLRRRSLQEFQWNTRSSVDDGQ